MDPKDQERWQALALEAGRVFTPNTPIDEKSLFTGRVAQIRRVVDVIRQSGQHAIVFGERGVGKTSLANVLHEFLGKAHSKVSAPRINCDSADSFGTTWRKAFEQVEVTRRESAAGFSGAEESTTCDATTLLGTGPIRPDSVKRVLTELSRDLLLIVIIDEFDRLPQRARRAFADTIKTLSDHAVPATVVLVGVADSVEQLVEEHQSVSRALVQIQMPRMTPQEIGTIIDSGLNRLGMTIDVSARERIVLLAQGLPHYAHLIGLHAARYALDRRRPAAIRLPHRFSLAAVCDQHDPIARHLSDEQAFIDQLRALGIERAWIDDGVRRKCFVRRVRAKCIDGATQRGDRRRPADEAPLQKNLSMGHGACR